MRNAIYGRQSIDKKDSISIETQIEKARSECAAQDLIRTYTDRGYSGKNTKRPEFKRLMEDVKKGLIDRIIVYKLDRFSRSILDFAKAWEILAEHRVEFISVNERFDTSTPMGKAMLYITIVFAQMERETIAERVTDNYYERAKRGSWMGGPAPYGFQIGRLTVDGMKIPTLELKYEIDIVQKCFAMYAENGYSLGGIATYLTDELRVPGPKRTTWNNATLSRMFRNPVYVKADIEIYAYFKELGVNIVNELQEFTGEHAGMLIGKRGASTRQRKEIQEATFVLANWEGAITSKIWLQCQQRLANNEQIKNTGKGKYTWLSGLMKCGCCGRSFRVIVDPKYPDNKKLYCSGRVDRMCNYVPKWHIKTIEKYVEREVNRVLDISSNGPIEDVPEISNTIKIQLKKIEEKINTLIENLSNEKMSDIMVELLNKEAERLAKERVEILEEIQENSKIQVRYYDKIDFKELDMQGKKVVAQSYIEQIKITEEEIYIIWKV